MATNMLRQLKRSKIQQSPLQIQNMIEGFEIKPKTIDNDYTELNGCETNKYIAN